MPKTNSFVEYVLHDAMREIPGVTAKSMFGGWGLYQNGTVFGIIADDQLYFKVDEKNLADYKERGSEPFAYESKNKKRVAMSYWEVPADILESGAELAEWVDKAVQASKRVKRKK
jgi:DNA transformation protein and related proteins